MNHVHTMMQNFACRANVPARLCNTLCTDMQLCPATELCQVLLWGLHNVRLTLTRGSIMVHIDLGSGGCLRLPAHLLDYCQGGLDKEAGHDRGQMSARAALNRWRIL